MNLPPFTLIYIVCFLIIFWCYVLSLLVLLRSPKKTPTMAVVSDKKPFVSILIPFHNEEKFLGAKIQNLEMMECSSFDYEVVFINGNSTDKSTEIINQELQGHNNWKLFESQKSGKIHQLNEYLKLCSSDLIVNSDVDAIVAPDAIEKLINVLQTSAVVGAAGAMVEPGYDNDLDKNFWKDQNTLRLIETKYHSSSSVVAPLYAFRRDLFDLFPEDCIADDLFVSFTSNRKNKKVVYLQDALATEMRGPTSFANYLRHKLRKAHANIKETLRFLNKFGSSNERWKLVFLNRSLQLMVAPFAFFVCVFLTLYYLSIHTLPSLFLVGSLFVLGLSGAILAVKESPSTNKNKLSLTLISLIISNVVLVVAVCGYFFSKNDSRYSKTS